MWVVMEARSSPSDVHALRNGANRWPDPAGAARADREARALIERTQHLLAEARAAAEQLCLVVGRSDQEADSEVVMLAAARLVETARAGRMLAAALDAACAQRGAQTPSGFWLQGYDSEDDRFAVGHHAPPWWVKRSSGR